MRRVRLVISGDVQGVGFRAWVKHTVRTMSITGRVKNREDGTVEIVGEGDMRDLDELIVKCQHGPDVSSVKEVEQYWSDATGEFTEFEVVY